MEGWLRDRLSHCLDFQVPDDMIKYILSIKNSHEFDEYFESLLNKECEEHRLFLTDCKQRLFAKALPSKKSGHGAAAIKQNVSTSSAGAGAAGKTEKKEASKAQSAGAKKKTKFVSLYADDGSVSGQTVLLKGRRRLCECQASQHKLINNCLGCGRVVCEQECSGPCLFCGELVCTNEEEEMLRVGSKQSEQLRRKLQERGGGGEALKQALAQRDRLLEYDRNSEKRTTVIDDELDYFQENSVWLSDAEREKYERLKAELHEKKHAGRAKRAIKVDFAGRELADDDAAISEAYERQVLQEVTATNDTSKWSSGSKHAMKITPDTCGAADPNFASVRPIYQAEVNSGSSKDQQLGANLQLERAYNRVQDKELLEMQDMRQCLSMHQPYASLLVAGIKKHEGRVWYTEHRGRLWIASTAKEPKPEDIHEVESFYRNLYGDDKLPFPDYYPTGCLLGCVKVEDCLPQEEYRELYPTGESESPFVFICSSPEELRVVFPIKGQHKIYQIDPKIHHTACKTLLRYGNTQA